jgi:hypothetical protein
VKVPHGGRVAIRIGPEPCVGAREGVDEASVGERIGQPLSRESLINPSVDVFESTEGNTDGCVSASARPTRRGPDPGMCGSSLRGNREISGLANGGIPRVRIGKTRSRSR